MTSARKEPRLPDDAPSLLDRLVSRPRGGRSRRRCVPSIGHHAERLVAAHLARRRFKILEMNFATRFGEIDLVARKGRTMVFVEVKARTAADAVTPSEAVTSRKQKRIARAAKVYLAKHAMSEVDLRFDVAEVIFSEAGAAHRIRLIEDAFVPAL